MSLLLSLARADPPAPPAVTAFARKTGDLAVLSSADIRVLALCLTLELEENGTWRVREYPGQALTGPPKEEKKDEGEEKKDGEGEEKGDDKGEEQEQEGATKEDEADKLVDKVEALKVDEASKKEEEQSAAPADPHASESAASSPSPVPAPAASAPTPADTTPAAPAAPAANDDEGDVSDAESDSSAGSWITPDNVHDHQVRDLGLFESPRRPPRPLARRRPRLPSGRAAQAQDDHESGGPDGRLCDAERRAPDGAQRARERGQARQGGADVGLAVSRVLQVRLSIPL